MEANVTKKTLENLVKCLREKHNLAIALDIYFFNKYRYRLVDTCFSRHLTVRMTGKEMNMYLHGMLAILENDQKGSTKMMKVEEIS